jgi:hypothetical protein
MRTAAITVLVLGMIGAAHAEEYPNRQPSYYRTVFIESATRACLRDEGRSDKLIMIYCECKATQLATFMTQADLDEIMQGGVHVTPRYWELARNAEAVCLKVVTGGNSQ